MFTLISIVVVVVLSLAAWVRSDAHTRAFNLFMCAGMACAVLVCTHAHTMYTEQEAAHQAEVAEAVAASVVVRTKLVDKFSVDTQDRLMDVFKNTYLAKVDRTCALALIISAKYAIKHKEPAYEGCGFTSSDFIAIGITFPHK